MNIISCILYYSIYLLYVQFSTLNVESRNHIHTRVEILQEHGYFVPLHQSTVVLCFTPNDSFIFHLCLDCYLSALRV